MRTKYIPDDYSGSIHLKNWFTKHMNMVGLSQVFIPHKEDKSVGKVEVQIFVEDSPIFLVFDDNRTIKMSRHESGIKFKEIR